MVKMKDVIKEQMDIVIISLNEDDDFGISVLTVQEDDPIYQLKLYQDTIDLEDQSFAKAMIELEDYSKIYTETSNNIYDVLNAHRDFWFQSEMMPEDFDKCDAVIISDYNELEELLKKKKGIKGFFNYFALDSK
jgi:hypothetical protein